LNWSQQAYSVSAIKINKELKEKSMLALEKVGVPIFRSAATANFPVASYKEFYLARSIARHPKLLLLDERHRRLILQAKRI
jgi:ABC-type branched-subunit amino acid transport system ATPase component